jgi:hypothetical protein
MNSKLTTLVAVSCTMLTLRPCFAEPGNFLIGASGGYAGRSSNMAATVLYNNPNLLFSGIPPSTVIEDYDDSGFTWGLLVGYQAQCESFILGAELSVDWEDYAEDHPFAFSDVRAAQGGIGLGWNGNFRYERDVAIALTARFGYELESLIYFFPPVFIPYIRFGVETSRDTVVASYSGDPAVYPFSTSSSKQRWPYRFITGVGTEFPILLIPGLSIRLEYNYHSSGQTIETTSSINDGQIVNPTFVSAMDPIIQSGKVSFIWNFF